MSVMVHIVFIILIGLFSCPDLLVACVDIFRVIDGNKVWCEGGGGGYSTHEIQQDQMNHNNCQSVVSLLNREIHNYIILTLKLVSGYTLIPCR